MSFREFIAAQREDLPILLTREHVAGRTIVFTGANRGIGLEAARHVAQLGVARLILAVRSVSAGMEAKADIEDSFVDEPPSTSARQNESDPKPVVEVWRLDLADWTTVRAFAERASRELDRLDVLVQNASAALDVFGTNEHGYERNIAANVFGTVMLAMMLLPKMRDTATHFDSLPHSVILTSGFGFEQQSVLEFLDAGGGVFGELNKEDGKSPMSGTKRYAISKLLQFLVIRDLIQYFPLSQTGVVINLLSPGLNNTDLTKDAKSTLFKIRWRIMNFVLFGRTPEMGSRTILHAMQAGRESHGKFLSDCRIKEHWVAPWVKTEQGQRDQHRVGEQFLECLEAIEPALFQRVRADRKG